MKTVPFIFLALLTLSSATALAAPPLEFRWEKQMPNYIADFSHPLGEIGEGLSTAAIAWRIIQDLPATREEQLAKYANLGHPLYQKIRDTQANYLWIETAVWPSDPKQFYDGAMSRVRLVLSDKKEIAPLVILAGPLSKEILMSGKAGEQPVFDLLGGTSEVKYAEFASSYRHDSFWLMYLGFPRSSIHPDDIIDINIRPEQERNDTPATADANDR